MYCQCTDRRHIRYKIDGNLVIGTNCDDEIDGSGNNEIIYSIGGIDQVYAKDGNDMIYGGLETIDYTVEKEMI